MLSIEAFEPDTTRYYFDEQNPVGVYQGGAYLISELKQPPGIDFREHISTILARSIDYAMPNATVDQKEDVEQAFRFRMKGLGEKRTHIAWVPEFQEGTGEFAVPYPIGFSHAVLMKRASVSRSVANIITVNVRPTTHIDLGDLYRKGIGTSLLHALVFGLNDRTRMGIDRLTQFAGAEEHQNVIKGLLTKLDLEENNRPFKVARFGDPRAYFQYVGTTTVDMLEILEAYKPSLADGNEVDPYKLKPQFAA